MPPGILAPGLLPPGILTPGLLLASEGSDPATTFSLMSILGSQLTVAAAAMAVTQVIKANTSLSGRWTIALVNSGCVVLLALLAWLMGAEWMAFDDWRQAVEAMVNVVGTSLMSGGTWALLLQGKEDDPTTTTNRPVTPIWALLVILAPLSLAVGGCTAPATVGEQQVLERKAAVSQRQLELVKSWPIPFTAEQCQQLIQAYEAQARWDRQVYEWSTGGAAEPLALPAP